MSNTMNHSAFASLAGVYMTTERIPYRTNCPASTFDRGATHYGLVIFRRVAGESARRMMLEYSQGSAHKTPPTVASVLGCLQMDASSVIDCGSFTEWAEDMGYDLDGDHEQAKATFKACKAEASKLLALLGSELFDTLMECEEE